MSPLESMLGRPAKLPVDLHFGIPEEDAKPSLEYVIGLDENAFALEPIVSECVSQKRNNDHKIIAREQVWSL